MLRVLNGALSTVVNGGIWKYSRQRRAAWFGWRILKENPLVGKGAGRGAFTWTGKWYYICRRSEFWSEFMWLGVTVICNIGFHKNDEARVYAVRPYEVGGGMEVWLHSFWTSVVGGYELHVSVAISPRLRVSEKSQSLVPAEMQNFDRLAGSLFTIGPVCWLTLWRLTTTIVVVPHR